MCSIYECDLNHLKYLDSRLDSCYCILMVNNESTHRIGVIDDCYRCLDCEIGSWNAHKEPCPAYRYN